MAYITWDYLCSKCGSKRAELLDKSEPIPDMLPCQSHGCDGIAGRIYSCTGMQFINMPQGGRNRFAGVREYERLKRLATKTTDENEKKRINTEMEKI